MLKKINFKGFTLVELMIAISIVAVLATVGFTVYSNTQSNARDTKRKQDIDAIAAALEGKKIPGDKYYQSVTTSDFTGGMIPEDPKANASSNSQEYCIITYTTLPPPALPVLPRATGATGFNKSSCANATYGTAVNPFVGTLPTAGTPPAPTTSAWEVCAFTENPATGIYCKTSN